MIAQSGTASDLILTRQKYLITDELRCAINFLLESRNDTEGWGLLKGMPSDAHHSSLAIEALKNCCDNRYEGIILDTYIYLKDLYENEIRTLEFEQLADLLMAAYCAQRIDEPFTAKLVDAIRIKYENLKNNGTVPIRSQCLALLAMLKVTNLDNSFLQPWIKNLAKAQLADGGWPFIANQPSALLSTSLAIRVLTHSGDQQYRSKIEHALMYIQKRIGDEGWENLGAGGDTFTQAFVLRALAETRISSYSFVRDGIDNLLNRRNKDGGWGGGHTEPSNVESTALCLLALISAGENAFVPTRLAQWVLGDVQNQLKNTSQELEQLQRDFEQRVEVQCGRVVDEYKKLDRELERLQLRYGIRKRRLRGKYRQASLEAEPFFEKVIPHSSIYASRDRTRVNRLRKKILLLLFPITLLSILIGLSLFPILKNNSYTSMLLISIVSAVLASLIISTFNLYPLRKRVDNDSATKHPNKPIYLDTEETEDLSKLRNDYLSISQSWRPAVREELLYRFITELSELPPDMGRRYTEELAARFKLNQIQTRNLLKWMDRVLLLSRSERSVLFDQLLRVRI